MIKLNEVSIIVLIMTLLITLYSFINVNSDINSINSININIYRLNNKIDFINKINKNFNQSALNENNDCLKFIKDDKDIFTCELIQYKKIFKKLKEIKSL